VIKGSLATDLASNFGVDKTNVITYIKSIIDGQEYVSNYLYGKILRSVQDNSNNWINQSDAYKAFISVARVSMDQ
jgi:hypothetical protein